MAESVELKIKPADVLAQEAHKKLRDKFNSDIAAVYSALRGAAKAVTTDIPGLAMDVADKLAGDTKTLGEKDWSEKIFSAITGTKKKDKDAELVGSFANPLSVIKAVVLPGVARSLPLSEYGSGISAYTRQLPEGTLYREMNAEALRDLAGGNHPFGAPITFYAHIPEMAQGQGRNKGIMIRSDSSKLEGRPYFGKPGLEQAFLNNAGEFQVRSQPSDLLKSIEEIWVTPEAFSGLSKGQQRSVEALMKDLQVARNVIINRTDKLPGR
jgi:hypothetical protein